MSVPLNDIYIADDHRVHVGFSEAVVTIAMSPEEMRGLAADLLLHAEELEDMAVDLTDAAFARAAGRAH